MTTAIATLSGGLDSGVAAALFAAVPGNRIAAAVFFAYGQRASVPEQRAACALAACLGVSLHTIELPWLATLAQQSGSALADRSRALPRGTVANPGDAASAKAVWVPARNAVFVSVAAAFAETLGADCVLAGFNREEAVTFADNSAEFLAAATAMLALGTRTRVRVESPTLGMDKPAIVAAARRLGFTAADFWSCYEGGDQRCGTCESCLRSSFDR